MGGALCKNGNQANKFLKVELTRATIPNANVVVQHILKKVKDSPQHNIQEVTM